MAFENIRENLALLETLDRPVCAEELYQLLCLVMDEIYDASGVLDASELACGDPAKLAQTVRYVLGDGAKAAQAGMEGIRELSAQSQRECYDAVREARQAGEALNEVHRALEEAEALRARREEAFRRLAQEKRELLEAQTDCRRLEGEIALLNDGVLEEKRAEQSRLQAELGARREADCALQRELDRLNGTLEHLRKELSAAQAEREAAVSRRSQLERRLASTREDIESAEQRAAEISALLEGLGEREIALLDLAASYTALFNALNAAMNEPFLRENIFQLSGSGKLLDWTDSPDLRELGRPVSSAEDLKGWMDSVQARIEALISGYQTVLRRTAELSGTLTARRE